MKLTLIVRCGRWSWIFMGKSTLNGTSSITSSEITRGYSMDPHRTWGVSPILFQICGILWPFGNIFWWSPSPHLREARGSTIPTFTHAYGINHPTMGDFLLNSAFYHFYPPLPEWSNGLPNANTAEGGSKVNANSYLSRSIAPVVGLVAKTPLWKIRKSVGMMKFAIYGKINALYHIGLYGKTNEYWDCKYVCIYIYMEK